MIIDENALISFTQRLVQAKSVTGSEQEVIRVLSAEMTKLGYDRIQVDEFGSLIGIVEGKQSGPTLLMDGHCDTVDANPPDWKHAPWAAEIDDGRLYGRGAADMKGSMAAMVYAAGSIDRSRLAGRIAVSATVTEENVEGGTLRNVVKLVQPDCVVIGEATELNLNRGGRGRAEIQISTFGRSAHSSSPSAGRCAVTDMIRVIQAIKAHSDPVDPFLGPGSMVLTDIISEPHPGHSVIPYRCRVTYDRRLLPGETESGILEVLRTLPGLEDIHFEVSLATQEECTHTGAVLKGEKFFPAWVFSETHPFVVSSLRGLEAAGLKPRIGGYRFCTNGAYCAGVKGIPTVGFGIGREEDAHIVDESIAVADLQTAVRGYQGIIQSVCSM